MKLTALILISILLVSCSHTNRENSRTMASTNTATVLKDFELEENFSANGIHFYGTCLSVSWVDSGGKCHGFNWREFLNLIRLDQSYCSVESTQSKILPSGSYSIHVKEDLFYKKGSFHYKRLTFEITYFEINCYYSDENAGISNLRKTLKGKIKID